MGGGIGGLLGQPAAAFERRHGVPPSAAQRGGRCLGRSGSGSRTVEAEAALPRNHRALGVAKPRPPSVARRAVRPTAGSDPGHLANVYALMPGNDEVDEESAVDMCGISLRTQPFVLCSVEVEGRSSPHQLVSLFLDLGDQRRRCSAVDVLLAGVVLPPPRHSDTACVAMSSTARSSSMADRKAGSPLLVVPWIVARARLRRAERTGRRSIST